jgi:broad specificity phosphatase PhoE
MRIFLPMLREKDKVIRDLDDAFRKGMQTAQAGDLLQRLFEEVAARWCTDEHDCPDVESWPSVQARVARGLAKVKKGVVKGSNTVVFTSGGPIAATIASTLELAPRKAMDFVWMSMNSSFTDFLLSEERDVLAGYNYVPHLHEKDLLTYR